VKIKLFHFKVFSGSYPKILSDGGRASLLVAKMDSSLLLKEEENSDNEENESSKKKRKKIEITIDLKEKM
jgi:hypothetical protein